jgi:hypothetical protein
MKRVDIFEIKGYEINTELDVIILDAHKKNKNLEIRKIDVLDKTVMKKHKDIVDILKKNGIESLPIVKVDGKVTGLERFENLMHKMR